MKLLNDLIEYFESLQSELPELGQEEKYCDICNGDGWISSHCGDERCNNCNTTGKIKK